MDSVSKTIKVIKVNCYSTSFSLKKYLFEKKIFFEQTIDQIKKNRLPTIAGKKRFVR